MSAKEGHDRTRTPLSRRGFLRRRIRFGAVAAVLTLLLLLICQWQENRLVRSAWTSGHVLLGGVVFLAAFRLRKMFPAFAALGTASWWMQLHAWTGIAMLVVFGAHVGWRLPSGPLESVLAAVFLATGASGLYGLAITRLLPTRLTGIPQQVQYHQIPTLRQQLAVRANQLVTQCTGTTLARHYVNHVAAFLHLPRPAGFLLVPSARGCKAVVSGLRGLDRYLSESERLASRELMQLVREKDDLDYHRVMQGRLKWWVAIHLALTVMLLVFAAWHVLLVYAFDGSGP